MVPSVMDSPICGIRTSVPGPAAAGRIACVAAAVSTAAVWRVGGGAAAVSAFAAEALGAAAEPASSMVQTTVLIWTVAPSCDLDLLKRAGGGRGNLGIDLVGGDLEERLVALDGVAGLLEPLGEGAFGDGFAHLGHDYVGRHGEPVSGEQLCARSATFGLYGRENED